MYTYSRNPWKKGALVHKHNKIKFVDAGSPITLCTPRARFRPGKETARKSVRVVETVNLYRSVDGPRNESAP
jgi:hypothetical protein